MRSAWRDLSDRRNRDGPVKETQKSVRWISMPFGWLTTRMRVGKVVTLCLNGTFLITMRCIGSRKGQHVLLADRPDAVYLVQGGSHA